MAEEIHTIWAFGRQSKYAHALPVKDDGTISHVALCGSKCQNIMPLHHWDMRRPEIRNLTCPRCLERIRVMDTMITLKQLDAMYPQSKPRTEMNRRERTD